MRYIWRSALLLLLATALGGCAALQSDQQPVLSADLYLLGSGAKAGQTFVARLSGLSSLSFYLSPDAGSEGFLTLRLLEDIQASNALAIDTIDLAEIQQPGLCAFSFPPQPDSNGKYYFAEITFTGQGEVGIGLAPGDTYLDGSLYIDGAPIDSQSAFHTSYARRWMLAGLLGEAARMGILGLAAAFLFVLPGWTILGFLPGGSRLEPGSKAAIGAAISVSLYGLIFLWSYTFGAAAGPFFAWAVPLLSAIVLLIRTLRRSRAQSTIGGTALRFRLEDAALAIVVVGVWVSRWFAIRSLDLPLWGDGIGHTLLTQLVIDHNGLFSSWQPYVEISSFTYHFMFHSLSACWHWLTGMDAAAAVLWTGQIVNTLAVLAVYPLATRLTGQRWAGVGAVLAIGLFSQTPMIYTNWSRYTQLTGQVIAPALLWSAWIASQHRSRTLAWVAVAALLWAGLAVSHYRVLLMALAFLPVLVLPSIIHPHRLTRLSRTALSGALGALAILPWILNLANGRNPESLIRNISRSPALPASDALLQSLQITASYLPAGIWVLAVMGLLVGLYRYPRKTICVAAGAGCLFFAGNPQIAGFPGGHVINTFTTAIAAYLPASVCIGFLAAELHHINRFLGRAALPATCATCLLAAAAGIVIRSDDIRAAPFALGTRTDVRAASWIRKNLPDDAKFLIPGFATSHPAYVGADGGWWLPYLAGREVDVWPLLVLSESIEPDSAPGGLYSLSETIDRLGLQDPQSLRLLAAWGIDFIFIGQRRGMVNNPGQQTLTPEKVDESGAFRLIYAEDRVRIYERIH